MTENTASEIRFILDVHLGKLARSLRLLGFDAFLEKEFDDLQIISFSLYENRVILTRDKGLLENRHVKDGYRIKSQDPDEQLRDVITHFHLKDRILPFSRCIECNVLLMEAGKDDVAARLFPGTLRYYPRFTRCPACDKIFWEGSHYERMKRYIESVIKDVN